MHWLGLRRHGDLSIHPDSKLDTVNNMGILYADQGHLKYTETMYNHALVGFEKAWGAEHTSMLNVVHNMRILYTDQGHLEDAEKMFNCTMAAKEKREGIQTLAYSRPSQ